MPKIGLKKLTDRLIHVASILIGDKINYLKINKEKHMTLLSELHTMREQVQGEGLETIQEASQEIIRPERSTAAEGIEYLMQGIPSLPKQVLARIDTLPINQLKQCSANQLYDAIEQVSAEYESVKRRKQWLEGAIGLKFEAEVNARRQKLEKTTGTVHIETEGFKITSDIPKKIEWDQKKLEEVVAKIITSGGKVNDYIETSYHIPEAKYASFNSSIKALLEPARTIKLGKSSYKLKPVETSLVCEGWL